MEISANDNHSTLKTKLLQVQEVTHIHMMKIQKALRSPHQDRVHISWQILGLSEYPTAIDSDATLEV